MSTADRGLARFAIPLLIGATCIAYWPALDGGFVWDDSLFILDNPLLGTWDGLRRIWLEPGVITQYYPLVVTSFWVEHRVWGLDPGGYHAVNVALHAANAVLVGVLLRRLGLPGATGAAFLFALHPVHVESVAWISERKNLLSGLLYLGAALCYLDFRGLAPRRADPRWSRYAAALALFAGALLSKTVTASLPAAIVLIVWWKEGRIGWRDLLPLAPFFALGVVAGLNTAWMERVHVGAVGVDWDFTLLERWLIATRALWFYPAKLLWPATLSFSYPRWDVDPADPAQYAYGAALGVVFVLLWAGRRRIGRGPLVAALFYAGTLFPALGFVDLYPMRFSFVADHFAYLASLGLIAPVAAGVARAGAAAERTGSALARPTLVAGLVLVLVALGVRTFAQSRIYHDEETLWRDTLVKNPASWLAHNNLGRILGLRGEHAVAETHFRRAVELEPGDHVLETNLAEALVHLGDHRAALDHARVALAAQPDHAPAHFVAWVALRELGALDEAVIHLHRYAAIERSFEAHYEAARHFAAAGRPRDALVELDRARQAGSATAELAVTRGNVLLALDQPGPAAAAFGAAVELRADWVPARLGLARALERAGRPALAARAYAGVLALDPDNRAAQRGLRRARGATQEPAPSGGTGRSESPGGDRTGVAPTE